VKLLPAVDLLGGRAVRLERGSRDRATIYREHPIELVAELAPYAARLHVVDLDGAFGEIRQRALLEAIITASPVPVEVGGGIRDRTGIDDLVALGAMVVVGTLAVREPGLVAAACRDHPGRIIVAVDARDGVVAIDGWTNSGGVSAAELGLRAADWGAAALLYTDVVRDGVGIGPNIAATAALAASVPCEVIASGGVGSLADLRALRDAGVAAVVVGRALYERAFTIEQAAAACEA
jgi:phosphoribosylformimino-5-aminoimidazole carboxamide ribotide isomerase